MATGTDVVRPPADDPAEDPAEDPADQPVDDSVERTSWIRRTDHSWTAIGPPPRLLVVASVLVIALGTLLAILGAIDTSVTTDEPIHVMRLNNFLDTGWYALDWDYGGEGPGSDDTNTFVYAPVAMLLLHAWSVLWGVEGWGEVGTTSHAYVVRHLGVVVMSLVGVGAVAAIGRALLRTWGWGLVAAAVLVATPMWTGHAMFNVKDVPVATGHTLVTLGLVLLLRAETPSVRARLARSACVVGGLVLTIGTRPGMWAGLTLLFVVAVVGGWLCMPERRQRLSALSEAAVACAVAATVLVVVYPRLFAAPARSLPRTSESSSGFLEGSMSDRIYVPRHLAQEIPSLLLLFMLTGAVVVVLLILRFRQHDRAQAARGALVGVQAFAVPVVATVLGSDLYHGLRQLLFILPALAVLAAVGMAWWLARFRALLRPDDAVDTDDADHADAGDAADDVRPGPPPRDRAQLVAVAAVMALVLPAVDQMTMQPYQTSYVNFATDVLSGRDIAPDSRLGDDYWRSSISELIDAAPLDRPFVCKTTTDPMTGMALPFANAAGIYSTSRSLDCREELTGPVAPIGLPVIRTRTPHEFDAVFIGPLPPNCVPLHEVTRSRHGFEVVVSTLGRCTIEPGWLNLGGARADDPALGTTAAGDLWRYAIGGWLQWPGRTELMSPVSVADLAFRPAPICSDGGCVLVIAGETPDDVVVTMGSERVDVMRGRAGALRLRIPAEVAGDSIWLSLSRESGEALGMRMTGISLRLRHTTSAT